MIPLSQGDLSEWDLALKEPLQNKYREYYIEAVQYGLLLVSSFSLEGFLEIHPIIFEEKSLREILELRRKI